MKLTDMLQFIEEEADERELRLILAAYGTGVRRVRVSKISKMRSELEKGDTIRFVSIKPKYLTGVEATVLRIMGDKAEVDMGQPIRRYSRIVTVPLSAITKVN